MWVKLDWVYISGIISGVGLLCFLLAISADAGLIAADGLRGAGTKFAGLAMVLGGGGMKWRSQRKVQR